MEHLRFICPHRKPSQTAKNLFIERRTLYLRLKKIEKILGDDFDQGKKRVALELAVYGMDYLHHLNWKIIGQLAWKKKKKVYRLGKDNWDRLAINDIPLIW